MKKILSGLLTVSLLTIPVQPSFAADDIEGHLFETEMRSLISDGILEGYGSGIYEPDSSITRAEFITLMVRALNLQPAVTADFSVAASEGPLYKDVTNLEDWYYSAIQIAAKSEIVKGYPDGTFQPNALISRQEMAVMTFRAINSKGIFSSPANIDFTDKTKIGIDYFDAIQRLVSLGIIQGNADNSFNPLANTTRGQTAAVIYRTLQLVDSTVNNGYNIVEFNQDGMKKIKSFKDFDRAKNNIVGNQAIISNNRLVFIKNGLATANPTTNSTTHIYNSPTLTGDNRTYVSKGTELQYLDASEDWVKVSIGNIPGYVKPEDVNLIHSSQVKGRTYYENRKGELYHIIYNHIDDKVSGEFLTGLAPFFMVEGQKYFSQDGVTYTDVNGNIVGQEKIYFNYLDLNKPTKYTAEDLDKYLTAMYPREYKEKIAVSPLAGLGSIFKEMEAQYGVNALYLMAHAIHESAWGTSSIAQLKNNLYGINATDNNAEANADVYASFEDSVRRAAQFITVGKKGNDGYLQETSWKFNGPYLGNKKDGMNVRYASDPFWGEKIAGHMYRADKYLGGLDSK